MAARIIVGIFNQAETPHLEHQTFQETCGGALALTAALQMHDLTGWTIVMRNDCTGALAALRKVCTKSEFLQDKANTCVVLARDSLCDLLFLHAPGGRLIPEGIIALTRSGMRTVRGPAVSASLMHQVHAATASFGWKI